MEAEVTLCTRQAQEKQVEMMAMHASTSPKHTPTAKVQQSKRSTQAVHARVVCVRVPHVVLALLNMWTAVPTHPLLYLRRESTQAFNHPDYNRVQRDDIEGNLVIDRATNSLPVLRASADTNNSTKRQQACCNERTGAKTCCTLCSRRRLKVR